jgi:hypothetical protein
MRIRTLALALALGCGLTGMAEAKRRPVQHRVSVKRPKSRAKMVKPRKAKRVAHR